MNQVTSVSAEIGGQTITIETGLLALQAAGSVTVRLADTILFSAVCNTDAPREGIDYFPLQVDYREKYYAAGRFPGGYFKRETRPSDRETLIARLTDRPIRPLFPEGYYNDVQIMNMLLSADGENDPDVLSVIAASASLHLSEIPFYGPIAAVRIGRIDGAWVINPTNEQREKSDLDLMYAGTRDRFLMMEGGADEIADEDFLAAMKAAQEEVVKLVDIQIELRRKLGLPDKVIVETPPSNELMDILRQAAGDELRAALRIPGKLERQSKVTEIKTALRAKLAEASPDSTDNDFMRLFDALEIETVRSNVLDHGARIDGRAAEEVRPLAAQVGLIPRAHGSALFTRGETQSLGTVTLGTGQDVQELDAIAGGEKEKRFMLHYNFPPYSTGEVKRMRGTSRRELGHGNLARRSLVGMLPTQEDFPYVIRIVAETLESNGSSSMASVCAGSLSLMDAGVPIKAPVAGIAMGLVMDGDRYSILSDILGSEDALGDMDFKVTGTAEGVTALQMDIKITGITAEIMREALAQAREGRLHILEEMRKALPAPREEISQRAPRILQVKIPVDKIGTVIGPGGKQIRELEAMGATVEVQEDGTVRIYSEDSDAAKRVKAQIEALTATAEVGKEYDGVVAKVTEFGAFITLFPGTDGLLHISQIAEERVERVEDHLKEGDRLKVKVNAIDERGKIDLVRPELEGKIAPRAPRRSGPPQGRGGDRGGRGGRGGRDRF